MSWSYGWRPYVPVHKRRAQAASYAERIAKKEKRTLTPIRIEGRAIARSFWGQAWCDHLERYCDFANRLPRGRTYVRNGSVIDLQIERGRVKALVSGSDIYHITVKIKTLAPTAWKRIQRDCASSIHSLIDLLQGRFDQGVMQRLTQPTGGLFPQPGEIDMECSCPDWAGMCKHVAAVLYGVGVRLDERPALFFTLRQVDESELLNSATSGAVSRTRRSTAKRIDADKLAAVFGIEIEDEPAEGARVTRRRPRLRAARRPRGADVK